MLKKTKAIIFDLDGTLIDSMWMWQDIDTQYLGKFGLFVPEDLQKAIEGMSFTETAAYFKERFKLPKTIEEIKREWNEMAYDKYIHDAPLKKGALPFLKKCKEKGIKLGIATSNSTEIVSGVIRARGIETYFDCIKTSCDAKKGKPAPDIYLLVADILGVKQKDCLVFEDVPSGIKAGKSAGMKVCAVDDLYSKNQEIEKKKLADYYIQDYTQILSFT